MVTQLREYITDEGINQLTIYNNDIDNKKRPPRIRDLEINVLDKAKEKFNSALTNQNFIENVQNNLLDQLSNLNFSMLKSLKQIQNKIFGLDEYDSETYQIQSLQEEDTLSYQYNKLGSDYTDLVGKMAFSLYKYNANEQFNDYVHSFNQELLKYGFHIKQVESNDSNHEPIVDDPKEHTLYVTKQNTYNDTTKYETWLYVKDNGFKKLGTLNTDIQKLCSDFSNQLQSLESLYDYDIYSLQQNSIPFNQYFKQINFDEANHTIKIDYDTDEQYEINFTVEDPIYTKPIDGQFIDLYLNNDYIVKNVHYASKKSKDYYVLYTDNTEFLDNYQCTKTIDNSSSTIFSKYDHYNNKVFINDTTEISLDDVVYTAENVTVSKSIDVDEDNEALFVNLGTQVSNEIQYYDELSVEQNTYDNDLESLRIEPIEGYSNGIININGSELSFDKSIAIVENKLVEFDQDKYILKDLTTNELSDPISIDQSRIIFTDKLPTLLDSIYDYDIEYISNSEKLQNNLLSYSIGHGHNCILRFPIVRSNRQYDLSGSTFTTKYNIYNELKSNLNDLVICSPKYKTIQRLSENQLLVNSDRIELTETEQTLAEINQLSNKTLYRLYFEYYGLTKTEIKTVIKINDITINDLLDNFESYKIDDHYVEILFYAKKLNIENFVIKSNGTNSQSFIANILLEKSNDISQELIDYLISNLDLFESYNDTYWITRNLDCNISTLNDKFTINVTDNNNQIYSISSIQLKNFQSDLTEYLDYYGENNNSIEDVEYIDDTYLTITFDNKDPIQIFLPKEYEHNNSLFLENINDNTYNLCVGKQIQTKNDNQLIETIKSGYQFNSYTPSITNFKEEFQNTEPNTIFKKISFYKKESNTDNEEPVAQYNVWNSSVRGNNCSTYNSTTLFGYGIQHQFNQGTFDQSKLSEYFSGQYLSTTEKGNLIISNDIAVSAIICLSYKTELNDNTITEFLTLRPNKQKILENIYGFVWYIFRIGEISTDSEIAVTHTESNSWKLAV